MRLNTLCLPFIVAVSTAIPGVKGGLISYGICQTGCNTLAVACYAAAGFTFGTVVASAATPAVIVGCNTALGTCSAGCATLVLLAPIP